MALKGRFISTRALAAATLGVLVSMALIAGGRWFGPLVGAQEAMKNGQPAEALVNLRIAQRRLSRSGIVGRLLPGVYDAAVNDELAIMYALKQYDEVIDRAGASGSPSGRFWAGCALFVKADVDVSDKNRLNWMAQAQQEFRAALEAAPGDFDARFNYELTALLIAGMKKDPTIERPKDLQMLVPSSAQAPKKVS